MSKTIKDGLPEGVALICENLYETKGCRLYTLYVENVPVAMVNDYDDFSGNRWFVRHYITDEKQFVDDIMNKYHEYLKDSWGQKNEEYKKQNELKEKSLRYSANAAIAQFKKAFL